MHRILNYNSRLNGSQQYVPMKHLTIFTVMNTINIAKQGMTFCGAQVLFLVAMDCGLNALLVPR